MGNTISFETRIWELVAALFEKLLQACWMTTDNDESIADFIKRKTDIWFDKDDNPVFLAPSSFY